MNPSGPAVSDSQNSNVQKWSAYVRGAAKRQDFWERALEWVSKGNVSDYMSRHRNDADINEVKAYFNAVIDWASSIFSSVETEMRGLEWGRLYETYHGQPYDPDKVAERVRALYADPFVKDRKGIFEFILGGETDTKLLQVRLFDEVTKRVVYEEQTATAQAKSVSNCPLCAAGNAANKAKIWALGDMDADHVSAWSKGGSTSKENCELLCVTHNRAKGNR